MRKATGFVLAVAVLICGSGIFADEGMWLLNNLPLQELKQKYNFEPTAQWVNTVQLSSARLPNCSASFVSGGGLVMTNGHCAEEAVQALSTAQNNLYENGFYAKTLADELPTDLTLRVLVTMADVTARVNQAVTDDTTGNPAGARQNEINKIQKDMVGLPVSIRGDESYYLCEVVVLYQGGQYHNYCYQVYDDVRLVFATEKNAWFFGGDADNFEFPRFTLDVAFLRAYEDGNPAVTPNHYTWSKNGADEGELIFVAGHPGSTDRLLTSFALATERDVKVPFLLDLFRRREIMTQQFMIRSLENERIAKSDLFGWQNARKLYAGKLRGLQDNRLTQSKGNFEVETAMDQSIDPAVRQKFKGGLKLVADAQEDIRDIYPKIALLLGGYGFDSRLYQYAQSLVSGNMQAAEAVLEARKHEPPLNLEYEEAKLRDSLAYYIEVMGPDDNLAQMLMDENPSILARDLIGKTRLRDANGHGALLEDLKLKPQDKLNILKNDVMTNLALIVAQSGNQYRKDWFDLREQEAQGYAKISEALFEIYGTSVYPDATFTLRLSYGTVSGYSENGKQVKSFTTIGETFAHAGEFNNSGDHKLPDSWFRGKVMMKMTTPLNFVSNLDITGGNSGSPVFNKNLEIVGIVFDSNIDGLVSDYDFKYNPNARAISVHSAGILEILRSVYGADRIARELEGK